MLVTKLLIFPAKKRIFCPKTAKFGPKYAFLVINNANKVPRWVFRYVGNKIFYFSSKKRMFCSKTTNFSPKLAFLTIAGSFGVLLMGWLVARGLYLARHLFTL